MKVRIRNSAVVLASLWLVVPGWAEEPPSASRDILAGLASLQAPAEPPSPHQVQPVRLAAAESDAGAAAPASGPTEPSRGTVLAAPPEAVPVEPTAAPPAKPVATAAEPPAALAPEGFPGAATELPSAEAGLEPSEVDRPVAGVEGLPPAAVMAEQQPERFAEMYDRVLDLEPDAQNRRLVERVREATQATEVGVDTTREEWVHVKDKSYLTWGGEVQGDWINWADDSQFLGQSNYVEFRRLRLFAAGEGYGVYDYILELEFAPEVDLQADVIDNHVDLGGFGVELKDAYVGIRDIPRLGYLRFGHFKAPLCLEELTSNRYTTFIERSLAHRFAPGRELGVGAYNHSLDENVTWAYGAFFDEMSESSHVIDDNNQGARLVGRATWTPFYDELSQGRHLLHTGLGYGYTRPRKQDDPLALGTEYRPVEFDARPEIHRGDPLLDTGEINCQQYHVLDAELAWVRGSFSVQSELVWTSLERMGGGTTDLYGTYVFLSYFLTGENRAYDRETGRFGRVTPYENFWVVRTPEGRRAGLGAWELAARWSYLDFSDVQNQRLHDLTLGCNWYWNAQTRVMLNWVHPFAYNSYTATTSYAEGDVVALRFQVDF